MEGAVEEEMEEGELECVHGEGEIEEGAIGIGDEGEHILAGKGLGWDIYSGLSAQGFQGHWSEERFLF